MIARPPTPVIPMPSIDISHAHRKSSKSAKAAVERVAQHIAERFAVRYGWRGNVCEFERSGVRGTITLAPGQVHVGAEIGFLLAAIKPAIEREVRRFLTEEFD